MSSISHLVRSTASAGWIGCWHRAGMQRSVRKVDHVRTAGSAHPQSWRPVPRHPSVRAGQYLRSLPDEELVPMVAAQWVGAGLLVGGDGHEASPFVHAAVHAAKTSLVRSHATSIRPVACAHGICRSLPGAACRGIVGPHRGHHPCSASMAPVNSAVQQLSVCAHPACRLTSGPESHRKPC
jgi:hypothetical protein